MKNFISIPGSTIESDSWEERDRINFSLKGYSYESKREIKIMDVWDEDARQLVEDGFIDPRQLTQSMTEYAVHLGILEKTPGGYLMKVKRKKPRKNPFIPRHSLLKTPRRNAHFPGRRYVAGSLRKAHAKQKAPIAGAKRRVRDIYQTQERPARRLNPGARKIGDRITKIKTTKGTYTPPGDCPIYGLKDGSVYIRGFFTNAPPGYVKEIWYMNDAKARREGYTEKGIPWKHDVKAKTKLQKTKGGLIMRRGKRPLWGTR